MSFVLAFVIIGACPAVATVSLVAGAGETAVGVCASGVSVTIVGT